MTYKIEGIPVNYLVDKQGKIIGKRLQGERLEQKIIEALGN